MYCNLASIAIISSLVMQEKYWVMRELLLEYFTVDVTILC